MEAIPEGGRPPDSQVRGRTERKIILTFQELGLIAPITKALDEMGYQRPSPIQEKAIPPALAGRDVLGCAQTGTGKTCAFAAPILQRLNAAPVQGHPIRALILTPTRELALQIQENIALYAKHLSLRSAVIFGGVGQNPQVEALKRGADILVATPGRLMDLYQQKFVDLSKLEIFVLDEADRMLDMGFIHDVRKILQWLPAQKQTLFFSATMPPEITDLVNSLLHDPARVAVDPVSSPVEVIQQSVYFVDKGNKTRLLAHLLEEQQVKNALVFTRTKHGANKVARELEKFGVSAAAIHGNKSQTARQQALSDFKAGKVTVLVATDIAARGLDIEELSHVFNYNLPEVPETYVHRIGRTGRAGHGGAAIALCDFTEQPLLKDIEKLIGRKVPVVDDHPWPMVVLEAPKRDKNGRIVNAEDAEARAAARERAAARRAAQAQPEEVPAAPAKRRRKKSAPAEEPLHAAPVEPALRAERPRMTRPGSRLETGDAMPEVEFTKPSPLDGDRILDATARLLAPRRGAAQERAAHSGQSRRGKKSAPKGESAPARAETSRSKGKKPAAQKAAQPKSAAERAAKPARKRSGPPRRMEPQRPHTKDSTEQPSLMKPFYIDRG
jgi:ATP-dependent RNA helicase RhlE